MNIYIGNFDYDITGDDLQETFKVFGYVQDAKVIRDKYTGDSKGFGFVEMPNKTEAQAAMQGITQIKAKHVTINEARPQIHSRSRFGKRGGPRNKNFNRSQRRY